MKRIKFGNYAKALVFELLIDECERIAKTTTDLSERVNKAYDFLNSTIPVEGIIDVTGRDYFGYGLAVGAFFATLDAGKGEYNES